MHAPFYSNDLTASSSEIKGDYSLVSKFEMLRFRVLRCFVLQFWVVRPAQQVIHKTLIIN